MAYQWQLYKPLVNCHLRLGSELLLPFTNPQKGKYQNQIQEQKP